MGEGSRGGVSVEWGGNVTLECSASGDPVPVLEWPVLILCSFIIFNYNLSCICV